MTFKDVANDPAFAPWRDEALKRGYASVIAVPLLAEGVPFGALAIYASEPDAFDRDEVELLEALANDLSHGVVALRDRVERRRAEEALRRAYDDLERRVADRTADLSRANDRLTREVAERERAEEALRRSERLYRQLTEGTRDAIVVADQDGRITLFNPAARAVFGYDEAEILGRPVTDLMAPGLKDRHDAAFRRYVETREARLVGRTVELTGRRRSGEDFPLEVSLTAIDLPEGVVLLGAIRDLTDRRRLQARMLQAEKLAALGLLSAGVAHEINNPLAYVANNLAVLERDLASISELLDAFTTRPTPRSPPPAPTSPRGSPSSPRRSTCPTSARTSAGSSPAPATASSGSPRSSRTSAASSGSTSRPSTASTSTRRSPAASRWSAAASSAGDRRRARLRRPPGGRLRPRPDQPGGAEPPGQRHAGDRGHRPPLRPDHRPDRRHGPRGDDRGRATTAPASPRPSSPGSSTPSTPPSRSARGPASASRSARGSSATTAAGSRSTAPSAPAPPSGSSSRSRAAPRSAPWSPRTDRREPGGPPPRPPPRITPNSLRLLLYKR